MAALRGAHFRDFFMASPGRRGPSRASTSVMSTAVCAIAPGADKHLAEEPAGEPHGFFRAQHFFLNDATHCVSLYADKSACDAITPCNETRPLFTLTGILLWGKASYRWRTGRPARRTGPRPNRFKSAAKASMSPAISRASAQRRRRCAFPAARPARKCIAWLRAEKNTLARFSHRHAHAHRHRGAWRPIPATTFFSPDQMRRRRRAAPPAPRLSRLHRPRRSAHRGLPAAFPAGRHRQQLRFGPR